MLTTSPKKSAGTHPKKREREGAATMETPVAEATAPVVESAPRKKRRKEAAVKRGEDGEQAWAWTALAESSVSALPPLFTPDSRYFFTSAASSLQIFSTATGKLVSTIPAHSNTITALILNPHDSTQLFSASLDGTLKRWDTHHGALLETLRIDQPVTHIAAHSSLTNELFVVTTTSQSKNSDSSHVFRVTTRSPDQLPPPTTSLSNPPKAHKSSRTTYVGKTRRATGLVISACGEFLIAIGGNKAYVSRTRGSGGFTTFVSPDPLTCVAVHPTESYFATGDERGVVRLWYCLNDATPDPSSSKPKHGSATAATTTLHWHAHAVSALAFAPSGAQLLSGGEEAVLVVWQLHSGQREYIPRVGAPIGAVSVCFGPTGGMEYAIALADGGVVFAGNDTLRIRRAVRRVRLDPTPTRPFPFVSHPATNRIILPATHPASLQILSRSGAGLGLLGELEVAPASRVSRKDETPIEPVRVGLVAISEKGKGAEGGDWLATVDSRADAEVYLKFWKWNGAAVTTTAAASNLCTLNTRIDRPHGDHRVTSIAFHAEKLATTGEDGLVKLWGVRKTQDEEYWICAASFSYRNHTPSKALFSPDGSLLAVIHGSCITLWDTSNNDSVSVPMRGALSCVETKEPRELAFVGSSGRYLAVLGSHTVALWDLVRLSVIWHVPFTFTPHQPTHIVSHPTQPIFALFQYPDSKSTRVSTYGVATPTQLSARVVPFKLDQPLWSSGTGDFGVLGVGSTDDSRWSLILAGDEVQAVSAQGGGINLDNAPFVPRTLFEDIFGRGAAAAKPVEVKENEKELETARVREGIKAAKRARRKTRRAEKMQAKVDVQEVEVEGDSDPETPDSSAPATEADAGEEPTVETMAYIGMKRKASLGGVDGTIHAVKNLVNGVVGVHSASDDEEDESGEEVV